MKIIMPTEPPCDLCDSTKRCMRVLILGDTYDLCADCMRMSESEIYTRWLVKDAKEPHDRG